MRSLVSFILSLMIGGHALAGSISGVVFYDTNANGVWEPTETNSPFWFVYIDANNNSKFDIGEKQVRGNNLGAYRFSDLPAGPYTIRLMSAEGWHETTPLRTVILDNGQDLAGANIGVVKGTIQPVAVPAAVSATQPVTQPSTLPATLPATRPVLISAFTTKSLLNAAGSSVKLPPGDYEVTDTTFLRGATRYDFTGVRFVATKPCTIFRFGGPGTKVFNGTYDSIWPTDKPNGANPKVGVVGLIVDQSDITLESPTFRNIDTGWMLYPGAANIWVWYPHSTPEIRGDAVYCGGGDETLARGPMHVIGGNFEDSQQEHGVRNSTPGFVGGFWTDCVFKCTNHKEPVALRAARNQRFYKCIFITDMFVGVGDSPPVVRREPFDIEFRKCQIQGGGYYAVEDLAHDILIDGGSIDLVVPPAGPGMAPRAIVLNPGVSKITYRNVLRRIFGQGYNKTWVANFTGKNEADVIKDEGGNQTVFMEMPIGAGSI